VDELSIGLFALAFALSAVVFLASGKAFLFHSFVDREKEPLSYWSAIVLWIALAAAMAMPLVL